MEIRLELRNRTGDSGYIHELFQLPRFNESVVKDIEDPSMVLGVIYYENNAVYPSKAMMGAYVVVEANNKKFVSIDDPVYKGEDTELGKQKVCYRALEMAIDIADMMGEDTSDIAEFKKQLYNKVNLLSNPSQN